MTENGTLTHTYTSPDGCVVVVTKVPAVVYQGEVTEKRLTPAVLRVLQPLVTTALKTTRPDTVTHLHYPDAVRKHNGEQDDVRVPTTADVPENAEVILKRLNQVFLKKKLAVQSETYRQDPEWLYWQGRVDSLRIALAHVAETQADRRLNADLVLTSRERPVALETTERRILKTISRGFDLGDLT